MSERARDVLTKSTWYWAQRDSEPTQRMPELVGLFERLAFCEADAQLAALAAAGIGVAPVEPTEEMLDAAEYSAADGLNFRLAAKTFWRAMLAVAPKP